MVTNGNLPSMLALADWLQAHGHQLEKVYVTYRLPSSKSNVSGALSILKTSGLSYLWFKLLLNKVMPWLLRLRGLPYSVESYIQRLGLDVPVAPVDSVKSAAFLDELKSLEADCLVSFSATQRFPEAMIRLFPAGAVNTHYGALPQFAGLSPYFWHLQQGEAEFGVTLHRIEEALDAGGIIRQVKDSVAPSNDCLDLLLRMANHVSPLLNQLFSGELSQDKLSIQDLSKRTYFGHPSRADMRLFKKNGHRMTSPSSLMQLVDTVQSKCPS